jgi:hypothetical protein
MPDFSSLLKAPAGEAVEPTALPAGDYRSVISTWSLLEAPKDKDYKIIIRLGLKPIEWPEDVAEEDRQQEVKKGQFEPINLSERALRRDYYDHRMFDVDQLFADCGLQVTGTYEEMFPQLVGCQVIAEVAQYTNQRTMKLANQVNNLRKAD